MKISVIIGTRPEAIKMCPLVQYLKEHTDFDVELCLTGQHKEMVANILPIFDSVPDYNFNVMQTNQTLPQLTMNVIDCISKYLSERRPDIILLQGDTTTVLAAALAAFYLHVKIGHVEAGLRTFDLQSPWPEEANRVLAGHLADIHFCPTETSRENLLKENIDPKRIFVTGNTVIDALLIAKRKIEKEPVLVAGLPEEAQPCNSNHKPYVLITGHRRENFGIGFENICSAILELAKRHPEMNWLYPVHLNPNVYDIVNARLQKHSNIYLLSPQNYLEFVSLQMHSVLILTDSGGVQEEAPSLGKPVLVMRDTSERPEALKAGAAKLVGTDCQTIVETTDQLLRDATAYKKMSCAINPYGDGLACMRIADALKKLCGENTAKEISSL